MDAGSFSRVSKAKREAQPISRSKDDRMGRVLSSQDAASVQELKASALRCHTPKQFRTLLTSLQTVLPYQNLACGWGYPASSTIGFFYNHSYPREFVRWYLTKGMLKNGPVFHEWLRTNKAQVTADVMRRMANQVDPELLERVERLNLQYTLGGGLLTQDLWVYFAVNMDSEQSCRTHLKRFQMLVPILSQALTRACPRPLLTKREITILERRSMGELIKQIAVAQGISDRTVRMHLQRIKKKLYTDDLVNAVVIAVRSGMLDQTWKEWRWQSESVSSG